MAPSTTRLKNIAAQTGFSVNYDIAAITRLAIDRVISLVNAQGELPPPRVTQVEPDIVIRESTAGRMPG